MYKLTRNPDNLVVPRRVLRGNSKIELKVQRPKGKLYRKSSKYRGFLVWNKLDCDVQKTDLYSCFVNKVKKDK